MSSRACMTSCSACKACSAQWSAAKSLCSMPAICGGFKALVRLARNVSALIADHDRWQGIDRDLWLLKVSSKRSVDHVRRDWETVERGVTDVLKESAFIQEARARMHAAIEASNRDVI